MRPLKILIVEDETITAMDLRETLEAAGHQVTAVVGDYHDALKAAKNHPPDLALIDIQLIGSAADGIATAKELLARHQMPIIYLTANADAFGLAKETMPAAYLLKPFRHDELKLQIELAYHYFQSKLTAPDGVGYLYWPVNDGYERVDPTQVQYLKADGSYAEAYVAGVREPYHISTNLKHLAQYFPQSNFYRLSRSMIINLHYLKRLEQNHLYLGDLKEPIQIPATSRKDLLKRLQVIRTK